MGTYGSNLNLLCPTHQTRIRLHCASSHAIFIPPTRVQGVSCLSVYTLLECSSCFLLTASSVRTPPGGSSFVFPGHTEQRNDHPFQPVHSTEFFPAREKFLNSGSMITTADTGCGITEWLGGGPTAAVAQRGPSLRIAFSQPPRKQTVPGTTLRAGPRMEESGLRLRGAEEAGRATARRGLASGWSVYGAGLCTQKSTELLPGHSGLSGSCAGASVNSFCLSLEGSACSAFIFGRGLWLRCEFNQPRTGHPGCFCRGFTQIKSNHFPFSSYHFVQTPSTSQTHILFIHHDLFRLVPACKVHILVAKRRKWVRTTSNRVGRKGQVSRRVRRGSGAQPWVFEEGRWGKGMKVYTEKRGFCRSGKDTR